MMIGIKTIDDDYNDYDEEIGSFFVLAMSHNITQTRTHSINQSDLLSSATIHLNLL